MLFPPTWSKIWFFNFLVFRSTSTTLAKRAKHGLGLNIGTVSWYIPHLNYLLFPKTNTMQDRSVAGYVFKLSIIFNQENWKGQNFVELFVFTCITSCIYLYNFVVDFHCFHRFEFCKKKVIVCHYSPKGIFVNWCSRTREAISNDCTRHLFSLARPS